jgi:hypothetical protein
VRFPFRKLHRAFRELDGFSDRQCALFIRRAGRRDPRGLALACVLAIAAFFLAAYLWFMLFWTLAQMRVIGAWSVVLATASPLVGAVAALLVRDAWLRRAVRTQIRRGACHGCGYSLLGLRVEGDALRCPECGRRITLEEARMSAQELLAPDVSSPGTSSAPPRAEAP